MCIMFMMLLRVTNECLHDKMVQGWVAADNPAKVHRTDNNFVFTIQGWWN